MLIILFPQRFVNCFYKSYQVNELKKKFKEKIEVHDMSNIISKNSPQSKRDLRLTKIIF